MLREKINNGNAHFIIIYIIIGYHESKKVYERSRTYFKGDNEWAWLAVFTAN